MTAWIVFLVIAIPLVGALLFMAFDESFVRIEPGTIGLMLVRGRATDKALLPGPHWVPALRRMDVQTYPSVELAYRAGDVITDPGSGDLERSGPKIRVMLGDRSAVGVSYTLRFRLDPDQLKSVHERFGPIGLWAAVQDQSNKTIRARLRKPGTELADLIGPAGEALQASVGDAVREALAEDGFEMTQFALGDLDLGRAGDVIQSTARAHFELEREEAEAATRAARARIDSELQTHLVGDHIDAVLRYREIDAWRELILAQPDHDAAFSRPARPESDGGGSAPTAVSNVLADPDSGASTP